MHHRGHDPEDVDARTMGGPEDMGHCPERHEVRRAGDHGYIRRAESREREHSEAWRGVEDGDGVAGRGPGDGPPEEVVPTSEGGQIQLGAGEVEIGRKKRETGCARAANGLLRLSSAVDDLVQGGFVGVDPQGGSETGLRSTSTAKTSTPPADRAPARFAAIALLPDPPLCETTAMFIRPLRAA